MLVSENFSEYKKEDNIGEKDKLYYGNKQYEIGRHEKIKLTPVKGAN